MTGAPALQGLTHLYSGKVRDLYAVDDAHVLVVASDRISVFDHILPSTVPDKGAILTQLSVWWFDQIADLVPSHLVTADVAQYPEVLAPHADALRGRSMLCRSLRMLPVECVARGYLTGSGWIDYQAAGEVCGIPLPAGLVDGSRLPAPIFTPATKAAIGDHDENIDALQVAAAVGSATAGRLQELTLAIYRRASEIAAARGIILADTKLEFGRLPEGDPHDLVLGDEVLTPDSSRFWPADDWEPGRAQPSYDKQYVRDWLRHDTAWDKVSPPPPMPEHVIAATRARYVEAYERLTGTEWATP